MRLQSVDEAAYDEMARTTEPTEDECKIIITAALQSVAPEGVTDDDIAEILHEAHRLKLWASMWELVRTGEIAMRYQDGEVWYTRP